MRGFGFLSLLAVVFITLKLAGVIAWPWSLVLLPLLPATVATVVLVGLFTVVLVATACRGPGD